eukprot:7385691-Prymnesium_polylepis.1
MPSPPMRDTPSTGEKLLRRCSRWRQHCDARAARSPRGPCGTGPPWPMCDNGHPPPARATRPAEPRRRGGHEK